MRDGLVSFLSGLASTCCCDLAALVRQPRPGWINPLGWRPRCSSWSACSRCRHACASTGSDVIDDRPRYMISVAAELVGMHPQTLRIYEQKGLVRPERTAGNTRLYSEADLERLRPDPAADQRARAQPRRRRGRARASRTSCADAGADGAARARDARGGRSVHRQYRRDARPLRTQDPTPQERTVDFNRLTLKIAGGRRAAQELARAAGQPGALPRAPAAGAARPGAAAAARAGRGRAARAGRGRAAHEAVDPGREQQPQVGAARSRACSTRPSTRRSELEDEYVSTEHLLLALDVVPREQLEATSRPCAAASASPRRIPRAPTRRSRSSAAT